MALIRAYQEAKNPVKSLKHWYSDDYTKKIRMTNPIIREEIREKP